MGLRVQWREAEGGPRSAPARGGQGQEVAILVVIVVIVGIAVFYFTQAYIAVGIICLAGFSKQFGWLALIATTIFLFARGHWIVGSLPILLMVWNLIGLRLLKGPAVIKDALAEDDSRT